MNTDHQPQWLNNTNNVIARQTRIMSESHKLLTSLIHSVRQSKAFNKEALEYLIFSASALSLNLDKDGMSIAADISNQVPEEAEEKIRLERARKISDSATAGKSFV